MDLLNYVNIRQGTRSSSCFSNGNTLPMTQLPFAMHAFVPQTTSDRGNWFYSPDDQTTEGIRLSHQPSPWIGDYTPLIFQPQRGQFYCQPKSRRSFFRREEAVLRPDRLRMYFARYRTDMEVLPTQRGGVIRLRFDGDEPAALALFALPGDTRWELAGEHMITGSTNHRSWKTADDFRMYFAVFFSCPIDRETTILDSEDQENPGVYVALTQREVEVRLAVSFVSTEQALVTLKRETDRPYGEMQEENRVIWNRYLSKIELTGDVSEEEKRTFYSCLYRVFLFPHKFYEIDEAGRTLHRCADTGKLAAGVKYVNNGFWDTFRTVYGLFSILIPQEEREMVEGFVNTYTDCGWLPKWPSPSEVGMMPGTLFEAVIADAAVKKIISGPVLNTALEGMLKEATQEAALPYGRHGTLDYIRYGYIPRDRYRESVSHTLDYVYGDFCIAQTLRAAGRAAEAAPYDASAQNYRKLFDPETGFMRGRDTAGDFAPAFDPYGWGGEYCEGGPWQSSFAVYHDYEGLAALYGGRNGLIQKLDDLFAAPPRYAVGGYGKEIHEMAEMAAQDFGQCAISNQPSFHIPWIYAEMDVPEKTEYWLERLTSAFSWREDGFPGDEDNGTMSAWYIFAKLGFYPSCPGRDRYIAVRPMVDAVLHLDHGDVVIRKGEPRPKYLPYSFFTE
ncbi:MAG: GH92 family glycosyl hydrolase [Faecousia sp.]